MNHRLIVLSALICMTLAGTAPAEVKTPAIFGDNMALQADKPVIVWGWATPGEQVTVGIDNQTRATAAGQDGKWRVELPAHPPGGPFEMSISGDNNLRFKNVVFGQVWLFSGQSNMAFQLYRAQDGEKEIHASDYPNLRLFQVERDIADHPRDDVRGKWVLCNPETVREFSAVAYFFGRDLNASLHQPMGLIDGAKGSTAIQPWMPAESLAADPSHDYYVRAEAQHDKEFADNLAKFEADDPRYTLEMLAWESKAREAQAAGQAPPPRPTRRAQKPEKIDGAAIRYNAMIYPLAPIALAGVVWYQGETNSGAQAFNYRTLLPEMIAGWRKAWATPDLPFLVVQLPGFRPKPTEPIDSYLAVLREGQALTAAGDPHVGLAVIIELGEIEDVHPKNKQDVGVRLNLLALKLVYGKDVVTSGPTFDSMKVDGGNVRIHFNNAEGMTTTDKKSVEGFAVAGEDKKFYWAKAAIDGQEVTLTCDAVPHPVAVRYDWSDNPDCNLVNQAGLPAAPFRTDDWPNTVPRKK